MASFLQVPENVSERQVAISGEIRPAQGNGTPKCGLSTADEHSHKGECCIRKSELATL
jgi:hypothetical protein